MPELNSIKVGEFVLQPHRQLLHEGKRLPLGSKALGLISVLAMAKGELVTKDELMDAVWPGLIVEENVIQVHVAALRKVLGTVADRLITVRGSGYHFLVDEAADALIDSRNGSHSPAPPYPHTQNKIAIAVLPLADMTAAQDQAQLIAGVNEEIVAAIARMGNYVPLCFFPKPGEGDLAAITAEVGVIYVLDGSVQTMGEQIRVTLRIAVPSTGDILHSSKFDGLAAESFGLQDRVASAIAAQLEGSVMRAEVQRIAGLPADERTAHENFLLARTSALRVDRPSLETARDLCEKAVALDRELVLAHSLLGWCHALLYQSGWSDDPVETRRRGLEHTRLAISSDDQSNHDVLRVSSTALCCLGADLTAADAILDRARKQSPDDYSLMSASAWIKVLSSGKQQQAIDLFELALGLDSSSHLVVFMILGQAIGHFSLQNFDEAARLANEAVSRRPEYGLAHAVLAASLAHKGEIEAARQALAAAPPETPFTILLDVTREPFGPRALRQRADAGWRAHGCRR